MRHLLRFYIGHTGGGDINTELNNLTIITEEILYQQGNYGYSIRKQKLVNIGKFFQPLQQRSFIIFHTKPI
ncbi:hypothetical protein CKY03_08220 [Photorhabdus sp. S9-53]|nr:hypothetical protein CKY03_08220 [Photorhabdus sp. S9-53]